MKLLTNSSFVGPVQVVLLALVAGCVTVNINFPETEIEDAADRIVGEARELEDPETSTATESDDEDGGASSAVIPPATVTGKIVLIALRDTSSEVTSSGRADDRSGKKKEKDIKIDLDDPIIERIRAGLKKRYRALLIFYHKAALGEQIDGLVAAREKEVKMTLKEKRRLRALVKAENRDRMNLYKRIVEVNDIDAIDIKRVQRIFARRWIAACKTGWWIQDDRGTWIRKPKTEKEKSSL